MTQSNIKKARSLLLRRLSQRDYTRFELTSYINDKVEIDPEDLIAILDEFETKRLVDDDRYLEEKVSYLRYQRKGNGWILQDLKKRGLDVIEVENYLSEEDRDEYIQRGVLRAESFMKRTHQGSNSQKIQKLKAHLARQGFEFNICDQIIDQLDYAFDQEDEMHNLKKVMKQSIQRYQKRFQGFELKTKLTNHLLSKGYSYEMIKNAMEDLDEFKN